MSQGSNRSPEPLPSRVFRWESIDHSLVRLKVTELAIEMHRQTEADESRIRFENRFNLNGNAVPSLVLAMKEKQADEWARRAYEIYCDVWKAQGNVKMAAFVRVVYGRGIRVMLRGQASSIAHQFARWARRTNFDGTLTKAHLAGLDLRMRRLQDHWFRQLEVEAKELEHAERRNRLTAASNQRSSPTPSTEPPTPSRRADMPPAQDSRLQAIVMKVNNPQTHTVLLVDEAKEYFRVTARTIHRWVAERKLQCGARRGTVTIESIQRWKAKRSRKRPSE